MDPNFCVLLLCRNYFTAIITFHLPYRRDTLFYFLIVFLFCDTSHNTMLSWIFKNCIQINSRTSNSDYSNSPLTRTKFSFSWSKFHWNLPRKLEFPAIKLELFFASLQSSSYRVLLYLVATFSPRGGTRDFKWRGWSKDFFWVWNFRFRDSFGYGNLASSFLGRLIWVGIFWGY